MCKLNSSIIKARNFIIPKDGLVSKKFKSQTRMIIDKYQELEYKDGFNFDEEITPEMYKVVEKEIKETSKKIYPNVVEPSFGLDRIIYALFV